MPVKVMIIRAADFIQVTPDGCLDLDSSKRLLVKIAWAKRPPADFEVLLDLRTVEWEISEAGIRALAEELGKHGETLHDRVAILAPKGRALSLAESFEQQARSRGYQVGVFYDFEGAIGWLFPSEELRRGAL